MEIGVIELKTNNKENVGKDLLKIKATTIAELYNRAMTW